MIVAIIVLGFLVGILSCLVGIETYALLKIYEENKKAIESMRTDVNLCKGLQRYVQDMNTKIEMLKVRK